MLISVEGTGKNQLQPSQESTGGCSNAVTLLFGKKSLTKTDRCAGALSRRNQLLVLHFYRTFPPDPISKATKDINVRFLIHIFKFL